MSLWRVSGSETLVVYYKFFNTWDILSRSHVSESGLSFSVLMDHHGILVPLPPPPECWNFSRLPPHWALYGTAQTQGSVWTRKGSANRPIPSAYSFLLLTVIFIVLLSVHVGVERYQYRGRGQYVAMSFPSVMWILCIELRRLALAAAIFTHRATSLSPSWPLSLSNFSSQRKVRSHFPNCYGSAIEVSITF